MEQIDRDLEDSITRNLNDEQINVFLQCIKENSSIFCTGRGGTGKSTVTDSIIRYYRNAQCKSDIRIAVTASTGVASFLIRGITLHRFAGTGIVDTDKEEMLKKACIGDSLNYWKDTDILIIDEISMVSGIFFDNISYIGKHIRQSTEPFGGIRLLLFGDFLQLPPVSKGGSRVPRVFESEAWKELNPHIFNLNTIVRQTDLTFTRMVSKVRLGQCTQDVCKYFQSLSRDIQYEDGIEAVRLYSLRKTTEEYNQSKLNSITSQEYVYKSRDKGDQSQLLQCPAPKVLKLRIGCQVMFTRNLSSTVVNGSIGTVVRFEYSKESRSFNPVVSYVGMENEILEMLVVKSIWETIDPMSNTTSSRSQLPLILAWAVTIHKSQGQTIPRLYVDLNNVFENGQAYVALSRCIEPSSLQVIGFKKEIVRVDYECLKFYNALDIPTQSTATEVASNTTSKWDNQTADTEFMLGNLSIREMSPSLQQDLEI